jgi:hypothetical protein
MFHLLGRRIFLERRREHRHMKSKPTANDVLKLIDQLDRQEITNLYYEIVTNPDVQLHRFFLDGIRIVLTQERKKSDQTIQEWQACQEQGMELLYQIFKKEAPEHFAIWKERRDQRIRELKSKGQSCGQIVDDLREEYPGLTLANVKQIATNKKRRRT